MVDVFHSEKLSPVNFLMMAAPADRIVDSVVIKVKYIAIVRGNAKLFGILLEQGYCDIKVAKTFHLKKGKKEALGK
jgi:hypothetical protein